MKIKQLALMTLILFLASLGIYFNENRVGSELLEGADYIKGLDIGSIERIVIKRGKESLLAANNDDKNTLEEELVFSRDENQFVFANKFSYPVDTRKINDLLYKIAGLQVKEKVRTNPTKEQLDLYGLSDTNYRYNIEIYDTEGKKKLDFRVGKNFKSKGSYLLREGSNEVYQSVSNFWINSSFESFIDRVVLDIDLSEIALIKTSLTGSAKETSASKEDGKYVISSDLAKKVEESKLHELERSLKGLSIEAFYPVSDSKVSSLNFYKKILVQLKNKLIYKIMLAKGEGEGVYFLKIQASLAEMPKEITVSQNADKDKLKDVQKLIEAQAVAQKMNLQRGAWVYKVGKTASEKIDKITDLML